MSGCGILLPECEDGYHGNLIVRKNGKEVRLRITDKQRQMLFEMGIEEYC